MRKNSTSTIFKGHALALAACLVLPSFLPSYAQQANSEAELQQELRYIEMLQQMLMPDIAEEVITDVRRRFPQAAAQLKVKAVQGLLSQGKFDEVQKTIDAIPDKNSPEYWAMLLAKADAYYAFGRYPEADKLYLTFFKKVDRPSAALQNFYRDSAYKYAQMLLLLGKDRQALDAFRKVFKVPLDENVRRNVQADMAELLLKLAPESKSAGEKNNMLAEAEKLVDQLLWKQDIWFGKAIVMKAHIALLRGQVDKAQDLVESYLPQLKIIHDALAQEDPDGSRGALRMSPMPQCRYLLAKLLLDEAIAETKKAKPNEETIKSLLLGARSKINRKRKGNGAFNHFINVFIRYPESQWASESGEKSEQVRELIKKRYGATLRTPVTPKQMAKVRMMQFASARLVFSQNQFKEAIDKYLDVLNQFPESEESLIALGDLVYCYIENLKDADSELMADTVTGYISERFCENPALTKTAGDQLRRIADHYASVKRDDKRREVYTLFFRDFPNHYATPQMMMTFGERELKAKNYKAAMGYYQKISTSYANSPYYYNSLSRIAQIYGEVGTVTNEMATLKFYVDELAKKEHPGQELVAGKFRMADAYRDYGLTFHKQAVTNLTLSAEEKLELEKLATSWLSKSAMAFGDIAKRLRDNSKAYQKNETDRKLNQALHEASLFSRAACLTQMAYPADKIKILRTLAIGAFEKYVKTFPEGKYAPKALVQIGTLYTILEDAAKAQDAFDRLAKNFPGSDEAKNSIPMLAASLIEMGLRGEGIAKYRQMFAAGGKYTEPQFMAAGRALEGAREFDLALQAYEKVLAKADQNLSLKAGALLGKARAQNGLKRYADAHKTLDEFIKDPKLSRLQQVVDANMLLVDVASEEGRTERDHNQRTLLFNAAIDALKMVRNYTTPKAANGKNKNYNDWTNEERAHDAELRLMSGKILVRRMDAEKKMNLEDKAAETRGEAIVAFMGMIMGIDPGRDELRSVLEKTYFEILPLMIEHKKFKDVEEYCGEYLKLFPEGQYKTDVNNWLNQAKIGQ